MKCKYCNGTGTSNTCVNGTFKPCSFCDGTGEYEPFDLDVELDKLYPTEQTNEEWLRQCSTEELVKMILDLCDYRPCFACGIGYCDDESWCHVYSNEAKEFVMEWLKQPHKPIS